MQVYGTKVLLPQVKVTVAYFNYPFMPFSFIAPKICSINWFSNLSILSVPYEGYSRNALCALNLISCFYFYLNTSITIYSLVSHRVISLLLNYETYSTFLEFL